MAYGLCEPSVPIVNAYRIFYCHHMGRVIIGWKPAASMAAGWQKRREITCLRPASRIEGGRALAPKPLFFKLIVGSCFDLLLGEDHLWMHLAFQKDLGNIKVISENSFHLD